MEGEAWICFDRMSLPAVYKAMEMGETGQHPWTILGLTCDWPNCCCADLLAYKSLPVESEPQENLQLGTVCFKSSSLNKEFTHETQESAIDFPHRPVVENGQNLRPVFRNHFRLPA